MKKLNHESIFNKTGRQKPDVSILIINYNGIKFLGECLDSIKTSFTRYSHEIIVVDNNSCDGSQFYLRNRTDINYIESSENLGFSCGNNLAARYALGKVILLLNNDTRIEKNLDCLIEQAMTENVGAVGPRIQYGDGRLQFSVGLNHRPLRLILSWLGLEKIHQLPSIFRKFETRPTFYEQRNLNIDWVSGACLATSKEIWDRLGGMDEAFFMYCEDVDYCLRVRNIGYKICFLSDSLVTHYEGAARKWIGQAALQQTARSYYIFVRKHFGYYYANFTGVAVAFIFINRSVFFLAASKIIHNNTRRKLLQDKSKSYSFVARMLFSYLFNNTVKNNV